MKLLEWTEHYIDSCNHFKRDLKSKSVQGSTILCEYKEGFKDYLVNERLALPPPHDKPVVLVCENCRENVQFLFEKWDKFASHKKLRIIFANPADNLQWSISPHLHNLVADRSSLRLGLMSLSEGIPEYKSF